MTFTRLALAAAFILSVGLAGCTDDSSPRAGPMDDAALVTTSAVTPQSTALHTATPFPFPMVSHLRRPSAFDVAFEWSDEYRGPTGLVIWREGGGTRRIDFIPSGGVDPGSGTISIDSDLDPNVTRLGCLWSRTDGVTTLSCSEGSIGGRESRLLDVLAGRLTGNVSRTRIADHAAECTRFTLFSGAGEYCYDLASGVPLRVIIDRLAWRLTAVSVSLQPSDFLLPVQLTPHPVTGDRSAAQTIDISFLHLSPHVQFAEP